MTTPRAWASITLLACTACGASTVPATTAATDEAATHDAPTHEAPVPVAEVDVARATYGCATDATSAACVAVAGFEAGHAPAVPTRDRAYIGVTQCPPAALPPEVAMVSVLVVTAREGELALSSNPTMTTSDVADALWQALGTPGRAPESAEARRIYESAHTTPVSVGDLATVPLDATLDARTFNAWMIREHDDVLYELDHADSDGNVCVTTFRPVADVEVRLSAPGPAVRVDLGEVSDAPPPSTADADVVAFLSAHWSGIDAVVERAVGPCATGAVGASPARGTPAASWPEVLGVGASCMSATPEGAAIGSNFLDLGDPHGPAGSWARYGRDGTRAGHCGFDDHDCSDFSVFMGDTHLVRARASRPLPSGAGWVTVEVLFRR